MSRRRGRGFARGLLGVLALLLGAGLAIPAGLLAVGELSSQAGTAARAASQGGTAQRSAALNGPSQTRSARGASEAGAAGTGMAAGDAAQPVVYIATVDAIIHPISAEFISDDLDTADAHNAAVIVLLLETPGGLVESTRTIITRMLAARTPVVVYVGPGAARAASAGFLITIAADVAVMAPAAHVGAAHPVSGTGENVGETMQQKMAEDVAAYARSLAGARKRNVSLAAEAVLKSRAFTADEALSASPPLIDFVARDLDELLAKLDGRAITRFDGRQVTLHTANARRETLEMTARQRFLSALAHPQVAYILFTLGLLGLTVELWNPGSVLPGVAGGLCLLLAFLAFQVLPINTTGLLLIIFGLFLLILEIKVPAYGVLGFGGALSLILGSLIMMNRSEDVEVSLEVIVPAMAAFAGIFLFLGRLAIAAQRLPTVTGTSAMIGTIGRALTAISPRETGRVSAHGEIWNARTATLAATSASLPAAPTGPPPTPIGAPTTPTGPSAMPTGPAPPTGPSGTRAGASASPGGPSAGPTAASAAPTVPPGTPAGTPTIAIGDLVRIIGVEGLMLTVEPVPADSVTHATRGTAT